MSAKTPENVIIRAIHEAFIKYPEGDGGPTLDYQWVQPEEKDAPVSRAVERAGRILCRPVLGGLHHQYVRI